MEEILHQAERLEKDYDWLAAAGLYRKALNLLPGADFLRKGEVQEQLSYALYRSSFQAESSEEFRQRLHEAILSYEKTKELYETLNEPAKMPRVLRSDAMIAFIRYWLTMEAREKKRLIDECWKRAREALRAFEEAGKRLEFGKTYNQLSKSADFSFCLEWDWQVRDRIIREATECGEQAIKSLSTLNDPAELARAYVKTADYLCALGYIFLNREERQKLFEKARGYWQKANELSEAAAALESLSILEGLNLEFGEGTDRALRFYEKTLEYGKKAKDKFVIGRALDMLAYHTGWSAEKTEDPEERVKILELALRYATEAKDQYSKVFFTGPGYGLLWVQAPEAEYYRDRAMCETDLSRRRDLLKQATDAAPRLLEEAEKSGYPDAVWYAHHIFAMNLTLLAGTEPNSEAKSSLLEKALRHRNDSLVAIEQIAPSMYWERGVALGNIGAIKSELSDLAEDPVEKKKMLQEAITNVEDCVKLLSKAIVSYEEEGSTGLFVLLGYSQYRYGLLLNRFCEFSNEKDCLAKAIPAFEEAAENYRRINVASRIAECHWEAAKAHAVLGEHLKAAQNFELASKDYKSAAEKTSQLKGFYLDYAVYMQAWYEIENARRHHEKQEYDTAKKHFQKAADLHKSLKKWSYLAPNYCAWANVEDAEDLSRREQCEESIQAFKQAIKLFDETKESIQNELGKIRDLDEKRMANSIIKATDVRHEYCLARIALEEAKILDKKGDHYSSSEKYGSAAEVFERTRQALDTDRERREFDFIISLSHAWQKMTQAEAEASPMLYAEASELFERAKEYSPNEQAKMLMLGHSRFCKALEEGTRFADTRDTTMHATATKYLESAANYYVNAGFQKASEYAKATQLLFDAYAQMDNAKRESDPEKKAKLYVMAEKVLQTSAGSFMKAEHLEKRERVLRLLDKVEEERELASSLTEVLHAPSIVSSTAVFTTPTPTREEAVGSERFEQADIQANLIVRQRELKIGEPLNLEIELVNAGKGPALLIKVNKVIPEGFKLDEKPEAYRVEDSYIDLKGKRLGPLKTEELRLVLKPKVQGSFVLKPTVLYLDENGKYKSHEPESVTIIVKELGIKGWIKGER